MILEESIVTQKFTYYIDTITNAVKEYLIANYNYEESELEDIKMPKHIEWGVVFYLEDILDAVYETMNMGEIVPAIVNQSDFQQDLQYIRENMIDTIVEEIVPVEKMEAYNPYDILIDMGDKERFTRENVIKWVKRVYRLD